MPVTQNIVVAFVFMPLAITITYIDVRYRRIPNKLVLATLIGGLAVNAFFAGWPGLLTSFAGFLVAFVLMLMLHLIGTMGAGDVKLFGAIGAIIGRPLVPKTFLLVAIIGGVLGICKMIYARRTASTMLGVAYFFYGLLPGQKLPRVAIPQDSSFTLPYAVPICLGSLIALFLFRA
jgi:prepilin peptidase CpaA